MLTQVKMHFRKNANRCRKAAHAIKANGCGSIQREVAYERRVAEAVRYEELADQIDKANAVTAQLREEVKSLQAKLAKFADVQVQLTQLVEAGS